MTTQHSSRRFQVSFALVSWALACTAFAACGHQHHPPSVGEGGDSATPPLVVGAGASDTSFGGSDTNTATSFGGTSFGGTSFGGTSFGGTSFGGAATSGDTIFGGAAGTPSTAGTFSSGGTLSAAGTFSFGGNEPTMGGTFNGL